MIFGMLIILYQVKFNKFWIIVGVAILGYIGLRIIPRRIVGTVTLIYSMTIVVIVHIHRMYEYYGQWKVGLSVIMMFQTITVSSIAFSYQDGNQNQNILNLSSRTIYPLIYIYI